MLSGLTHSHSGLRWILLILLITTIINSFKKWKSNSKYTTLDNKLSLYTMIVTHIQLLIGFGLYFMSGKVKLSGLDMHNTSERFFTVEHIFGMLVAITLITLGRIQSKKISSDTLKHKKTFIMYLIALIIILITIPWPFREALGIHSWF